MNTPASFILALLGLILTPLARGQVNAALGKLRCVLEGGADPAIVQ